MTAKTARSTAHEPGFYYPGVCNDYPSDGCTQKGKTLTTLPLGTGPNQCTGEPRLRRGPTTMHARKPSRWTETNRYRTVPYRTVTRITPRNTHNTHNTRSHATRGCDTFGGVAA